MGVGVVTKAAVGFLNIAAPFRPETMPVWTAGDAMDSSEESSLELPNSPGTSPRMATWPKVEDDYHGAVVRLAAMRAAKTQYLLFGYVELYPRDIPVPSAFNAGEKPWSVPNFGGDVTLTASALPMSATEALAWYEEAAHGRVKIPLTQPVDLIATPFGVEPALGRFSVGETVPFAAPWHDGPRIHRLIAMGHLAEAVTTLGASRAARDWLATNVGFDPFDHEDWLGSLAMLAPDPLLSSVGQFTLERTSDGAERIVLQARRRRYDDYPAEDADNLTVTWLQERPSGWTEVQPCLFDADGLIITTVPEPVGKSGYAVTCPTRGLLRMTPPQNWIEQVNVGIGVVSAMLEVEVPAGGRRKPAARYLTHRVNETSGVQVGETLPFSGAIRLVQLQETRKDRIRRESAPQRLFSVHDLDNDELTSEELAQRRAEAEAHVAGLVSVARKRVVFVDPNFGVREFQNYALRVMLDRVSVTVLTGAPHMRKARTDEEADDTEENTATLQPPGVQFLRQLKHVESELGKAAPQVLVMPGSRKPIFHDRFLVVDDVVWAFGPSFNELGERIGLISQVHEPRIVIAAVERAVKNATGLESWVANFDPAADSNSDNADAADV